MLKILTLYLTIFLIVFVSKSNGQSILIYGGDNHDVFLGCLNCDKYNQSSIWNSYGEYGSRYSSKSLWNTYGEFGGRYSDYSPFNKYAGNPPVLVDKEGNFYGYFTADKYHADRTKSKLALFIVDYWQAISQDVNEYYEKIFN